jgi:outer membrane protein
VFVVAGAIQRTHAQPEIVTAAVDQKSSTRDSQNGEREAVSNPQIIRSPFKQGRWFTRVGYAVAGYHSSTAIATNGQPLSGGSAQVSNNMTLVFDVGYEVTKNISVSMMSGIPVKPHVTGEGTAESLGILGKVRYGPAMFTGYYRFPKVGRFRPYVGGGAAYAIIFKNIDGNVKQLKVHNNWGLVIQGGAEYEVNSSYTVFVDFKEVWLAVKAHGVLSDGTDVNARVKLNPSLVSVGIKFRFPFGRSR